MPNKRRTRDEWKTIFEAQVASGMRPGAYCEHNNLHLKTFYARRSDINSRSVAAKGKLVKVIKDKPPSHGTATTDINLRYKGVEVHCDETTNPSWIASLIKGLTQ